MAQLLQFESIKAYAERVILPFFTNKENPMKKHIVLIAIALCSTLSSLEATLTISNKSKMTVQYKSMLNPLGELPPGGKVEFQSTPPTITIREMKSVGRGKRNKSFTPGPWHPLASYLLDIEKQKREGGYQNGYLTIKDSGKGSNLWTITATTIENPE